MTKRPNLLLDVGNLITCALPLRGLCCLTLVLSSLTVLDSIPPDTAGLTFGCDAAAGADQGTSDST